MARSKVPFQLKRIPYTQRGEGHRRLWEPVNILNEDATNSRIRVEFYDGISTWINPNELKHRLARI